MPHTAQVLTTKAVNVTAAATTTSLCNEKGSKKCPAKTVVSMKPAIIIVQTTVAAAPRLSCSTVSAKSTSNDVPAAPTPMPIKVKAMAANAIPAQNRLAASQTETAASNPPNAKTAIPPIIHGVRLPPLSEP